MSPKDNPVALIRNKEDAAKFDFFIIPFYKITPKGINYKPQDNILDIIEIDSTFFWAFILYNHKYVGCLEIFLLKNKWVDAYESTGGSLDLVLLANKNGKVFESTDRLFKDDNEHSPKDISYTMVKELSPDYMFTVKYLNGLWFVKGNEVKVYDFYDKKICSASEYTTQTVKHIHRYAKGEPGGGVKSEAFDTTGVILKY